MGNRGRPPFKRWEIGKIRKLNKQLRRGGKRNGKKGQTLKEVNILRDGDVSQGTRPLEALGYLRIPWALEQILCWGAGLGELLQG